MSESNRCAYDDDDSCFIILVSLNILMPPIRKRSMDSRSKSSRCTFLSPPASRYYTIAPRTFQVHADRLMNFRWLIIACINAVVV